MTSQQHSGPSMRLVFCLAMLGFCGHSHVASGAEIVPWMSSERVVFVTAHGDIEFGFYPEVAPKTAAHIFRLCSLGLYTSNHIFRVDKNFVAQVADVASSRTHPTPAEHQAEAASKVPLEVVDGVKHHAGILSMGRYDDPNSGTSSFSMLLGDAQHLDMQYTIFGKVTKGMEVLRKLESLPTKTEGIFVMPLERLTLLNTYWYYSDHPTELRKAQKGGQSVEQELAELKLRFDSQAEELQRTRKKCLPV